MYPGIDGFLGTRASLMLDAVVVAMVLVLPVLGWSIYTARWRRRYRLHKNVQLALAAILLVTVLAFEADMRINGWRDRAAASPYFDPAIPTNVVNTMLAIHLMFSTTTTVLWLLVIVRALRKFPRPLVKGAAHSKSHKFWGWLAAIDLALTAVTGWIFYYLAFVAA